MRAELAGLDEGEQVVRQPGGGADGIAQCAQIHHDSALDIAEGNPEQNQREDDPPNRILLMAADAVSARARRSAAAEDAAGGPAHRSAAGGCAAMKPPPPTNPLRVMGAAGVELVRAIRPDPFLATTPLPSALAPPPW